MGNTPSNTGRGDEPTHVIRDIGDGDTKREHRPVNTESTEDEAEATNRKSNTNLAPESSYSYMNSFYINSGMIHTATYAADYLLSCRDWKQ